MTDRKQPVQRLRITFALDGAMRYASVLDHGRTWERMLGRAGIPLAYTQGYNPHPRIQFAGGFPVGYSSACECVDILLTQELLPEDLLERLTPQCPRGIALLACRTVPIRARSLQASLQAAAYTVTCETMIAADQAQEAIDRLLVQESVPAVRVKKGREVTYDLRPLVHDLKLLPGTPKTLVFHMNLKCGAQGSGRPEQVLKALGIRYGGIWIHRAAIQWADEKEAQ